MLRYLPVIAFALLSPWASRAAIVTCNTTSSGGSMTGFTGSGNGCRIEDKVFSNFSFGGTTDVSGIALPDSSGINLQGVGVLWGTGSSALGIRLRDNGSNPSGDDPDWTVSTDSNTDWLYFDSQITYQVAVDPGYQITRVVLSIASASESGDWSGSTTVSGFLPGLTIVKEVCPGVTVFSTSCSNKLTLTLGRYTSSQGAQSTSGAIAVPFTTELAVRDRVFINFGSDNSTRSWNLPELTNRFEQALIPEPSTFILLGTALGIVAWRRRNSAAR